MLIAIVLILLLVASLVGLVMGLVLSKRRLLFLSAALLLLLGIGCWAWLVWFFRA